MPVRLVFEVTGPTPEDVIAQIATMSANIAQPPQFHAPQAESPVDLSGLACHEAAPEPASVLEEPEVKAAIAKRERGQPAPGRKRRTKEEIAEDDAADEAERSKDPGLDAAVRSMARPAPKIEPADAPAWEAEQEDLAPAEESEVAAQDAADEKAEAEAASDGKLTHDDLRQAMGLYVKTYGIAATQEDGTKIFESTLGPAPAGEKSWKLSLVPDDQGALMKAVHAWSEAVESNPFDRAKVA